MPLYALMTATPTTQLAFAEGKGSKKRLLGWHSKSLEEVCVVFEVELRLFCGRKIRACGSKTSKVFVGCGGFTEAACFV
jgi:hypothetical protein